MTLTVTIDDKLAERARAFAAEQQMPLEQLLAGFLEGLCGGRRSDDDAGGFVVTAGEPVSQSEPGWSFSRAELYRD